MKFSILTIAGALASTNAVVRGDAALKLKKMQKLSTVNKNAFHVVRRMNEEGDGDEEAADQYQYQDNADADEAVDEETGSGVKPYMCVTATLYDGGTASFMSFTQSSGDGESAEYITDINSFISMRGQMYAQEMANTCQYCEMEGLRDLCEQFQDMDSNTAQVLAAMDTENFEAYLLAMYQEDEDADEDADEGEEEELSDEVRAYYTYSKGGNTGAQALINLCSKCEEECDDDELQQYYEEMVEDYAKEESLCVETNDGRYIGYTCGADGSSIELAVFQDNECTVMSDTQDGYNMASMWYNSKNDEEARMIGEMQMMTQMYSSEFSCQMGADRSQDGGDEDADENESEFCENLLAESISKDDCAADGNYNYQNQGEGEDMNEYAADEAEESTGVMIYSDDIEEVCGTILAIEEALVEETYVNPYTGTPFSVMSESAANRLSSGAIIGITALVAAIIAAAGFALGKFTRTKSELEEPVFQGSPLH
eukprot:scaffold5595_cov71-Skeletonema_dohrnii-CCMP3373.AAC.5